MEHFVFLLEFSDNVSISKFTIDPIISGEILSKNPRCLEYL